MPAPVRPNTRSGRCNYAKLSSSQKSSSRADRSVVGGRWWGSTRSPRQDAQSSARTQKRSWFSRTANARETQRNSSLMLHRLGPSFCSQRRAIDSAEQSTNSVERKRTKSSANLACDFQQKYVSRQKHSRKKIRSLHYDDDDEKKKKTKNNNHKCGRGKKKTKDKEQQQQLNGGTKKEKKTIATRASHVVTHRTTGLAWSRLTSQIWRDGVQLW